MRKIVSGSLLIAVAAVFVMAQGPSNKAAAPVGPVASSAPANPGPGSLPAMGKPLTIDFSIPLKPWKQADLKLSMFQKRPALLFYFSPTCGHCRHTYPHIQGLQKLYESKGLAFVAIISGTASNDDILDFDSEFKLSMPAFRDQDKVFTTKYGTGSVPLILLVDPKGGYRLWNGSDDATLANLDAAIKTALKLP
jgi:thiol-disulfide isomerase/thioredoxin